MIERGIIDALTGDDAVSTMTGNRIRPMVGKQSDNQPRIAYLVTADAGLGGFGGPCSHSKATVEIDSVGDTYLQCAQLSAEIKRVFNWKSVTTDTVRIDFSKLTDETDVEQALIEGKESPAYIRTQTFEMLYREIASS